MMCSPFTSIPPSKQKSAVEGLSRATSGVPRMRNALIQRAEGEVLLAEVYPSEKYRGEKVRKYNRIILATYSIFKRFRLNSRLPPKPSDARHARHASFSRRHRQRHPRPRDGCRAEGQLGPSGHADGHGGYRRSPVAQVPALQPEESRVARPR